MSRWCNWSYPAELHVRRLRRHRRSPSGKNRTSQEGSSDAAAAVQAQEEALDGLGFGDDLTFEAGDPTKVGTAANSNATSNPCPWVASPAEFALCDADIDPARLALIEEALGFPFEGELQHGSWRAEATDDITDSDLDDEVSDAGGVSEPIEADDANSGGGDTHPAPPSELQAVRLAPEGLFSSEPESRVVLLLASRVVHQCPIRLTDSRRKSDWWDSVDGGTWYPGTVVGIEHSDDSEGWEVTIRYDDDGVAVKHEEHLLRDRRFPVYRLPVALPDKHGGQPEGKDGTMGMIVPGCRLPRDRRGDMKLPPGTVVYMRGLRCGMDGGGQASESTWWPIVVHKHNDTSEGVPAMQGHSLLDDSILYTPHGRLNMNDYGTDGSWVVVHVADSLKYSTHG
jgi:hypothetical protein